MRRRFGIILFDSTDIIFRVYEATELEWKLVHYHSAIIEDTSSPKDIDIIHVMEIMAEFFSTEYAQHIAEWKTFSRHLPQPLVEEISTAIGLTIENITPLREQELLCKGMFTELW